MSYEPPTLEGRAMVDLGHQLTAMRARAEQAEADNARLLAALEKAANALHDFDNADVCSACLAEEGDDHAETCGLGRALVIIDTALTPTPERP